MQEVAVVQRLQAEVVELGVAVGQQGLAETVEIVERQLGVQQFEFDGAVDVGAEVLGVDGLHFLEGGAGFRQVEELQRLVAQRVQQQACGDVGVVGFLLDAGAGRQRHRLRQLGFGNAVVEVAQRGGDDFIGVDAGHANAGFGDDAVDAGDVEGDDGAVIALDRQARLGQLRLLGGLGGALLGATFAVQHVVAGHLVFAGAHQGQFDLVLDVFDVQGAAAGDVAGEALHHLLGQGFDLLAHGRAGRGGAAFNGEKGLGQRDVDLAGVKAGDLAVAANDAQAARGGCGQFGSSHFALGRSAAGVGSNGVLGLHCYVIPHEPCFGMRNG